jgi:hypothetical protein
MSAAVAPSHAAFAGDACAHDASLLQHASANLYVLVSTDADGRPLKAVSAAEAARLEATFADAAVASDAAPGAEIVSLLHGEVCLAGALLAAATTHAAEPAPQVRAPRRGAPRRAAGRRARALCRPAC